MEPIRQRHGVGLLAQLCGRTLTLGVHRSAAGHYIGTVTDDGPFTRESAEYWRKREHAERALREGTWTQRLHL